MIDYHTVIEMLKRRLPEFIIEKEFSESPTIVFGFIPIFLYEVYKEENYVSVEKCVSIINDLAEIDNVTITALLDEVAIGLHGDFPTIYEDFKSKLSDKAKIIFEVSVQRWTGKP